MDSAREGDERGVSSVTGVALMVAVTTVLAAIVVPPMLATSDDIRGSGAPDASFGVNYRPDAASVQHANGFERIAAVGTDDPDAADRIRLHYHGNTDIELGNLVVYVGDERIGDVETMAGSSRLVSGGSLVLTEEQDGPIYGNEDDRYLEGGDALEVVWSPPEGDDVLVYRATIPKDA